MKTIWRSFLRLLGIESKKSDKRKDASIYPMF